MTSQLPLDIIGVVFTQVCVYCKVELTMDEFSFHSGRKNGYDTRCKKCKKERDDFVKRVKLFAPMRPMLCQVPGCENLATTCDHDHTVKDPAKAFRGWICDRHNTNIGMFGDTIEGIRKETATMIEYLQRFENGRTV
jgi:hypothetical protein